MYYLCQQCWKIDPGRFLYFSFLPAVVTEISSTSAGPRAAKMELTSSTLQVHAISEPGQVVDLNHLVCTSVFSCGQIPAWRRQLVMSKKLPPSELILGKCCQGSVEKASMLVCALCAHILMLDYAKILTAIWRVSILYGCCLQ